MMKKYLALILTLMLATAGLAEGLEAYVGRYSGLDPWGNALTVEIESVSDGKLNWRYTEDFAGQVMSQSLEGAELTDGRAPFHIEGAVQDSGNTTCDYTGALELKDGAVALTYTAGEMTESSPEGGSTAYHVEALDEAARTVTLERAADFEIDYGSSQLYTREELEAAAKLVLEAFRGFEGCEMHALRYAGDACNTEENLRSLAHSDKSFVQVAEFVSDFHSPVEGGGAWDADTEYRNWEWWLARPEGGDWQLIDWGYC